MLDAILGYNLIQTKMRKRKGMKTCVRKWDRFCNIYSHYFHAHNYKLNNGTTWFLHCPRFSRGRCTLIFVSFIAIYIQNVNSLIHVVPQNTKYVSKHLTIYIQRFLCLKSCHGIKSNPSLGGSQGYVVAKCCCLVTMSISFS